MIAGGHCHGRPRTGRNTRWLEPPVPAHPHPQVRPRPQLVALPPSRLPPTQRDPEVVVWPSVFLEAWGAKDKKPLLSVKCVVLWPWCPKPPKNHLANKLFGIPLAPTRPLEFSQTLSIQHTVLATMEQCVNARRIIHLAADKMDTEHSPHFSFCRCSKGFRKTLGR